MSELSVLARCAPLAAELSDGDAVQLEALFAVLADRNRLKIVSALLEFGAGAYRVCELEPLLGLSQPTVSYHLKRLTDAGLLEREKRGTHAFYRLAPHALDRLRALVPSG